MAILISFLIKTFLIRSFYIPSESMENTLQINDRIIVNELEPNLIPIQHGDIVVFRDPGGWLPPDTCRPTRTRIAAVVGWALSIVGLSAPDSNDHLIKRVIGLPGDHVACCNAYGQMTVNGVPLNEPYVLLPPGSQAVSGIDFRRHRAEELALGDGRQPVQLGRLALPPRTSPASGFVPINDVVGRAVRDQLADRVAGPGSTTIPTCSGCRGRPEVMPADPTLRFERSLFRSGVESIIACDEVGRGALAGPVAVGWS